MSGPARVLHQRRTAGGEVALGAVAEPAGAVRDVRVLGDAELGLRPLDELAILPRRARHGHRVDRVPAVLLQELLRTVDRELESLRRPRRQLDELDELLILVATHVGEALDLPRHDAREEIAWVHVGAPVADRDRLPRLVPRELASRNRRGRRADVRPEREQTIEPLEELHVPRLRLGDGELRERRIGVDEDLVRNARVLVAPEPGSAREIDEEIRVRRVLPDLVGGSAMIAAVVVHERPAVAEPERLERVMNIGRSGDGIRRTRVLHRVVDALAGVLDVEDLMAEGAQAEQVHQRAPGDAAKWIAGDDAGEEDPHFRFQIDFRLISDYRFEERQNLKSPNQSEI